MMADKKISLKLCTGIFVILALLWIGNEILPMQIVSSIPPTYQPPPKLRMYATIDISIDNKIVASNPGNMLLMGSPDGDEYGRLLDLSAEKPEEFKEAITLGNCRLIPDGEKVEVLGYSVDASWWKIQYKGKAWWIIPTFMKNSEGVAWSFSDLPKRFADDS